MFAAKIKKMLLQKQVFHADKLSWEDDIIFSGFRHPDKIYNWMSSSYMEDIV